MRNKKGPNIDPIIYEPVLLFEDGWGVEVSVGTVVGTVVAIDEEVGVVVVFGLTSVLHLQPTATSASNVSMQTKKRIFFTGFPPFIFL